MTGVQTCALPICWVSSEHLLLRSAHGNCRRGRSGDGEGLSPAWPRCARHPRVGLGASRVGSNPLVQHRVDQHRFTGRGKRVGPHTLREHLEPFRLNVREAASAPASVRASRRAVDAGDCKGSGVTGSGRRGLRMGRRESTQARHCRSLLRRSGARAVGVLVPASDERIGVMGRTERTKDGGHRFTPASLYAWPRMAPRSACVPARRVETAGSRAAWTARLHTRCGVDALYFGPPPRSGASLNPSSRREEQDTRLLPRQRGKATAL